MPSSLPAPNCHTSWLSTIKSQAASIPIKEKTFYRWTITKYFFSLLAVYTILGAAFLPSYQYQINPDGISYISIAQKYLNGDFANAVNGHWGPMISWLLVPILFLGVPPLLGVKIILFIAGGVTLAGITALSYEFEMREEARLASILALVPSVVYMAYSQITPDLLITCFLVFYLVFLSGEDYAKSVRYGVLCGLFGALAYFSKNYALPFFALHFLLFNIIHYFRETGKNRRKAVLRNLCAGYIVFFVITSGWIYLLSSKYGGFTIGTAGRYNFLVKASPEMPDHPILCMGLLKPPNETAPSAWEDPSYLPLEPWSPLDSTEDLKHYGIVVAKNILEIYSILDKTSDLHVIIVAAYIFMFLVPLKRDRLLNALFPLAALLLYSSGYALVYVERRYLYLNEILIALMGGQILSKLSGSGLLDKLKFKAAMGIFMLCFMNYPIIELVKYRRDGDNHYLNGQRLKRELDIRGNIASNKNYGESMFMAFHMDCKYYGETRKNEAGGVLIEELNRNKIDYYFLWDPPAEAPEALSRFKSSQVYEIKTGRGEVKLLRIFHIANS